MRPRIRVVVVTTALAALTTMPAAAHPGFRPDEVPAGERTDVELAMAHDCEVPGGGTSPTTVVDVQIPEAVGDVEPLERDGWTLNLAGDADGSILRVEWTRDAGTTEAEPPVFRLLVTPATQESTATIPWKVYQGCETGEYRWGAGSEGEPSVDLTVTPGTYTPRTASPIPRPTPSAKPTTSASPAPITSDRTTPANREQLDDQGPRAASPTSGPPWLLLAAISIALVTAALWLLRARFGHG